MNPMLRRIFSLLAAALAVLSHAAADDLDNLAEALRKGSETLASTAAGDQKPDSAHQQRLAETLRLFTEVDQALARANASAAQAVAGRLENDPTLLQPLRETAGRLRRELPALLDAREEAFVATVEKLVARTREQCLAAKKEADLQPLLREVSQLDQSKPSSRSPYTERAARKLKAVVTLLPTWMEYLAAKEAGNGFRLEAVFQQLARDNMAGNYPILPDSEITRRVDEFKPRQRSYAEATGQMQEQLAHAKSLGDIAAVAAEIKALPRVPDNLFSFQIEQQNLQLWFGGFAAATAAFLSGDIDDAWRRATALNSIGADSWGNEAIRLRALLLGELAVKSLHLAPAQARRPDETTADHLLRLARTAAQEQHWEEVLRIQRLYGAIMGPAYSNSVARWWVDSSEAVTAYLEGQRLEAAGDSASAVTTYLRVLRATGDLVPAAEAQDRLRALLAAQKTTLPEVRLRLDSERLANVVQYLGTNLAEIRKRNDALERVPQIKAPPALAAAAGGAEIAQLDARLKKLEAVAEKFGKVASQSDEFQTRLGKMETLLAPALEADPAKPGAADGKVRVWLGPDFTVYRSAVPPAVNARLDWVVRFNGKTVLTRTAKREMQFNYDGRKPGTYTIYLTEGGETPVSNVIDYTLTEEAAKKLGPRIIDDDFDRDGARNPPAPRGQ